MMQSVVLMFLIILCQRWVYLESSAWYGVEFGVSRTKFYRRIYPVHRSPLFVITGKWNSMTLRSILFLFLFSMENRSFRQWCRRVHLVFLLESDMMANHKSLHRPLFCSLSSLHCRHGDCVSFTLFFLDDDSYDIAMPRSSSFSYSPTGGKCPWLVGARRLSR